MARYRRKMNRGGTPNRRSRQSRPPRQRVNRRHYGGTVKNGRRVRTPQSPIGIRTPRTPDPGTCPPGTCCCPPACFACDLACCGSRPIVQGGGNGYDPYPNHPASQNAMMPGKKASKLPYPMNQPNWVIADCSKLSGGGSSPHYATCVGMADDFEGTWI